MRYLLTIACYPSETCILSLFSAGWSSDHDNKFDPALDTLTLTTNVYHKLNYGMKCAVSQWTLVTLLVDASSFSGSRRTLTSCGCVTVSGTSSERLLRSTSRGGRCIWGCMTSARSAWGCSPRTSPLRTPTSPKVGEPSPQPKFLILATKWFPLGLFVVDLYACRTAS